MSVKQSVEWELGGETEYSKKTCPRNTLSTRNLTWPDRASYPGPRGGKPATNRLIYGTCLPSIASTKLNVNRAIIFRNRHALLSAIFQCAPCLLQLLMHLIMSLWQDTEVGRSRVQVPTRSLDFFNWPNPSSCTMALGSTQPLTEMSTKN
jgi:hypothetical protein